mmetsp:Transcript_12258/g.49209  ORF Transcript_12258/g.49209 Transcript_12258/m.49209 type:complete len:203 (-) Transcript_12258:133-741(-)
MAEQKRDFDVTEEEAKAVTLPQEKLSSAMVGTWDWTVEVCMGPDQPKFAASTGHSVYKSVLGGLFVEGRYYGAPGKEGLAFEGVDMINHDNVRKEFTAFWADNMCSQPMHSKGNWNHEKQCLEMKGIHDDTRAGIKDRPFETTTTWSEEDGKARMVYAMDNWDSDGKRFTCMTVTSTRRPEPSAGDKRPASEALGDKEAKKK